MQPTTALGHLAVIPLLLLTFMFGPAGLLAFLGLKSFLEPSQPHPSTGDSL